MSDVTMEGRVLAGKYELTRLLGQGGMGAVYEARNHLGKRYAVKLLLKPEFAQDAGLTARFFKEAKASAAIESEHIVQVYDTGVDPDTSFPFIIMELLKGEDLEHTIARVGAINVVGAARVISQASMGLGRAHEAGIVHRDIKPANIFMTAKENGDSVVKILDFGIAKQTMDALSSSEGAGLTKTGSMLGTPLYMSPEQAQGLKTLDGRTDIWSLGMCLYEALSGRTPWGDVDTLGALILSICSRDVMPLQDIAPWVPPELAQVVHRCLQRDVNQRMPSALALVQALQPFCGGSVTINPDVLLGVEDAQRLQVQPRAEIVQSAMTNANFTSSQPSAAATQEVAKPSSKAPMMLGIAALLAVLVGGGVFAATRMGKSGDPKEPGKTQVAQPKESATTTASTSAAPPPPPPEEPKTVYLPLKIPKGAKVKVGKEDVTEKVKDGKLALTGLDGAAFIVTIQSGKEQPLVQKVYLQDGATIPEEIDFSKGEVVVAPPPPKANGGAGTTAPKATAATTETAAAPTGAPKPPTPTADPVKPPPKISNTFD
jgi:serine/threonine-protein kinase